MHDDWYHLHLLFLTSEGQFLVPYVWVYVYVCEWTFKLNSAIPSLIFNGGSCEILLKWILFIK